MSKKMSDSERYDRMRRMEKEAELTRRKREEPAHKKEGKKPKRQEGAKHWQWAAEEEAYLVKW